MTHTSRPALSPLVAVSPHYDDAVFSCGTLLATLPSSIIITIFAGRPENDTILTDWDDRCGFSTAGAAMRARTQENQSALRRLNAIGIDLDFLDSQYRSAQPPNTNRLGEALSAALSELEPATVLIPMGLYHEDHIHVSDLMVALYPRFPSVLWLAYEDIPYRKQPRHVRQRVQQLTHQGIALTSFCPDGMRGGNNKDRACPAMQNPYRAKESAVRAYSSQFHGLGYRDARPIMSQTEKYWRLHRTIA